MIIIPAIDLKNGQCVRLKKGDFNTAHQVAQDAVETARSFLDAGAHLIHMVDLDGAKDGHEKNYDIVSRVAQLEGIDVELGGGIRDMETIDKVFSLGVRYAIIGTEAVRRPQFVEEAVRTYGDRIVVGIDIQNDTVRTEGWLKDSGKGFVEFSKLMESFGVDRIIFTDIDKDGLLEGPSFEKLSVLRQAVDCKIVASGGVTTVDDVIRLRDNGIDAAIVGKAIYSGDMPLEEAIREAEKC